MLSRACSHFKVRPSHLSTADGLAGAVGHNLDRPPEVTQPEVACVRRAKRQAQERLSHLDAKEWAKGEGRTKRVALSCGEKGGGATNTRTPPRSAPTCVASHTILPESAAVKIYLVKRLLLGGTVLRT